MLFSTPATPAEATYSILKSCTSIRDYFVYTIYANRNNTETVTKGFKYYIRAGSNSPRTTGEMSFSIKCVPPPPNDKPSGAVRVPSTGVVNWDNTGATSDSCTNDVFYVFSAPCTGFMRATACGTPSAGGYGQVSLLAGNSTPSSSFVLRPRFFLRRLS